MNRLLPPLLVFVVWIALWGELSWANAISGVVVVALIGWLIRPVPRAHVVDPLGLVKLLAVFTGRLVTSSVAVVLTVLAPTPARLRSGVVTVRLRQSSPLVATIVADAISLTPGTLTLDAQPEGDVMVLEVHVLGLGEAAAVRDDIARLEATVLGAVRPREGSPEETTEAGT